MTRMVVVSLYMCICGVCVLVNHYLHFLDFPQWLVEFFVDLWALLNGYLLELNLIIGAGYLSVI